MDAVAPAPRAFEPSRVATFFRHNVVYVVMMPLLVVVGVAVHEAAHVVSVTAEGGTVLAVELLPTGDPSFRLGEVRWIPHGPENRPLIAFAPTVVWTSMAVFTALLAPWVLRRDAASRIAVLIGFFLPIADASLAAAGLFCHVPRSDWSVAFRGYEPVVGVAFAAYVTVFGEIGLRLFRRCWGPDALSSWEYTLLYVVGLAIPWIRHAF